MTVRDTPEDDGIYLSIQSLKVGKATVHVNTLYFNVVL